MHFAWMVKFNKLAGWCNCRRRGVCFGIQAGHIIHRRIVIDFLVWNSSVFGLHIFFPPFININHDLHAWRYSEALLSAGTAFETKVWDCYGIITAKKSHDGAMQIGLLVRQRHRKQGRGNPELSLLLSDFPRINVVCNLNTAHKESPLHSL